MTPRMTASTTPSTDESEIVMLVIPPPLKPGQRRPLKQKKQFGPPPITGPQIVSVTFGEDPTQMNVVVGADLVSVDSGNAMRIFIPGLYWVGSNEVDLIDATHLTITFTESVAAGTMWMTPFPEVWEFVSGESMVPPFNGAIG